MKDFAILLDSTCDLSPENLSEFNLDYCKMSISIENKVYEADLGWPEMSPREFYEIMKSGKRPYTQLVAEPEFRAQFGKYLDQGLDVLYIGCSSRLSASVKEGAKIANDMMKERPDSKIIVIDALNSGMGQGFMGIRASELRKAGKTIDEVAAIIEQEKLHYLQFATVGSLTYLKNAGRVKAGAAFFGNIIGIKPIIISDVKGNNYAYKKVRGRKAALQEIADSVVKNAIDPEHHYLGIDNADCIEDAKTILSLIEEKGIKFARVFINSLGPILGASCGPETISAYFYGEEVTIEGE